VKSETIDYRDGDLTLKGFVAFDDSKAGKRPGILVNPEGFGLGPHAKSRAERLAQLGYVALAADPFGGGAIAKDLDEAMKLATPLMSDTAKLRARAHAGLHTLAVHPLVDTNRLVSIGYCMGGTFKAKILVCNGNDDPFVPAERVTALIDALTKAGADWQIINYGGTVHSFTNPEADSRGNPALKYDKLSDERSWKAMLSFFDEIFA